MWVAACSIPPHPTPSCLMQFGFFSFCGQVLVSVVVATHSEKERLVGNITTSRRVKGRGVCCWSKLSLVKRITRVRRGGGRKERDSPMEEAMNTFPCVAVNKAQ